MLDDPATRHRLRQARWPAGIAAAAIAVYASESLRHHREGGRGYDLRGDDPDVGGPGFLRAAEALTSSPVTRGNQVDALVNGDAIFPVFLATIANAERSVNLLTYVYWRGDIAKEVAGALCEKAREGIPVNVLLDAMGSVQMESGLIRDMEEAGVCVARFRPPKPYAVRRLNNRTHRKVLVADGRVGMIGGLGIAEEWTGDAQDPDHWRDTHLRVEGPAVRNLQGAFAENWLEASGDVLVGEAYLPQLDPMDDGGPTQLVRSKAGVGDTNIEALYFLAIACAQRTLELTSAYFAPRPAFVAALVDAARRGVDVRILVPGEHIDKQFVRIAGRRSYGELLAAGVRIWEYAPTMLHAKVMVVDGAWSSVGSVNFDNRSFQLHDEATLCVQSRELARGLSEQFRRDLGAADEITRERWEARSPLQRARERLMTVARREL